MSREIKFRAWDSRYKKMIFTGFHLLGEVMAFAQIEDYCLKHKGLEEPSILRWNDIIIMQYTGLKDKNGKEIYEGDIIQFFDRGNMLDNDLLPCTAQVIMKYARWYPEPINIKGLRGFKFNGYDNNEDCEVIGTVYENPELLR